MPENIGKVLERYVPLLKKLNRQTEASPLEERLTAINAQIKASKGSTSRVDRVGDGLPKSPFESPAGTPKH